MLKSVLTGIRGLVEERGVGSVEDETSRLRRFGHFWVMVFKSFSRNRCFIRAAALAYTTLLALIPTLAIGISVSASILKSQGEAQMLHLVDRFIASVIPPGSLETNTPPASAPATDTARAVPTGSQEAAVPTNAAQETPAPATTNIAAAVPESPGPGAGVVAGTADLRGLLVRIVHEFVARASSGTLGATGTIVLVFVAISMLARIEDTFNDIWGVQRRRSWFARIWHYSAVITVGPILLGLALGFVGGPSLKGVRHFLEPLGNGVLAAAGLQIVTVLLLCLGFAVFYILMPNTRVHWQAAATGGLVGGLLWHLNTVMSVHYVSRAIYYGRIFGSLAMVPIFMVGLYIAWLIVLFGAQVAYAYQNRAAYVQEKQTENINQRGREFIALRVMAAIGWRFQHGEPPATVTEIAAQLAVPSRLVLQLLTTLAAARIVVEVAGQETAYAPARPIESLTCHDILLALRAGHGHELATSDEPARAEVFGEFQQILEAERRAASAVTVRMMVNRVEAAVIAGPREVAAVAAPPGAGA
jgi:membrane protein